MNNNKLWNKNFFLLWQGQLVSCLGDALYSIALGFWVLEKTGSSTTMGVVLASISIPRIIFGPIGGVIVDRFDRKKIILLGDFIRGFGMLFVAYGASKGFLEVWMVMIVGIICGTCSAFFNPSIMSVMPDIVPNDKLIKANSAYQIATSSTNLVGNMSGGFLYSILGAPVMFLINGASYLISSFTEIFIQVPKVKHEKQKFTLKEDFKDGFKFLVRLKGLLWLIGIAGILNFLFGIFTILLMPWFRAETFLGVARYGIVSGINSLGMVFAMMLLSSVKILPNQRFKIYVTSLLTCVSSVFVGTLSNNFYGICIFYFVSFGAMAISNIIANSVMQIIVPQNMRGKVNSLMVTACTAIQPIGMLIGGGLGDVFYPRNVILVVFFISICIVLPMYLLKSTKLVINYNPETDSIDKIYGGA
ncbi:MAG: MFS transporter [Romboutsia sp.]